MGEDMKALINVCKPHTMLILDEVITFRSWFLSIISMKERNEWPFRISPICCKARGSWPLLRYDCRCFFFFSTFDCTLELPTCFRPTAFLPPSSATDSHTPPFYHPL